MVACLAVACLAAYVASAFAVAAPARTLADTPGPSSEEAWTDVLVGPGGDFRSSLIDVLARVRRDRPPAWPEVSAPRAGGEEADSPAWRRLAEALSGGLARHEELRDLGAEAFAREIETLLRVRDLVGAEPGYVNLLLGDVVERIAYVELAVRMASERDTGAAADRLVGFVDRLASRRVSVQELRSMVATELGEEIALDPEAEPRRRFVELLGRSGPSGAAVLARAMTDPDSLTASRLLAERDLGGLLARLWLTDQRVRIVLPLYQRYWREAEPFDLTDRLERIRATLDLSAADRRALGTGLDRARATIASDVAALLASIREGSIDLFPSIGPPSERLSKEALRSIDVGLSCRPGRVRPGEPLRVEITVRNGGFAPVEVAHPLRGADGTLELVVADPTGDARSVSGPWPPAWSGWSVTRRASESLVLEPGSEARIPWAISLDWGSPDGGGGGENPSEDAGLRPRPRPRPVFAVAGRNEASIRYRPRVPVGSGGPLAGDDGPVLVSNVVDVRVEIPTTEDREALDRVLSRQDGWRVFRPESAGELDPTDARALAPRLDALATELRGTFLFPYAELAALLARRASSSEVESDLVARARRLAETEFQYRDLARSLRESLDR